MKIKYIIVTAKYALLFHDTRSDSPAAALGMAILLMSENDAVSDRLWGTC